MRGPIQLFKDSVILTKGNAALLYGIAAIPLVTSVVVILFRQSENTSVINIGVLVFYLILSILYSIALALAFSNKVSSVGSAYRASIKFLFRSMQILVLMSLLSLVMFAPVIYVMYLWIAGLTGIGYYTILPSLPIQVVIMLLFVLFTMPATILQVKFLFSPLVLVVENTSAIESLRRSNFYVKGRWWKVFGRVSILIGVTLVAGAILGKTANPLLSNFYMEIFNSIVGFVVVPISFGYLYLIYQDAKKEVAVFVPTPTETTAPTV